MIDGIGTVPAFATFQRLTRSDGQQLLAKFKEQAKVEKEIEYFLEKAGKLKDVEDFFKDQRLMRFVLSAYGLDDEIQYPGRLKKVLLSKAADPDSLANRMRDPRFGEMARELLFGDLGTLSLSTVALRNKIVDRYVTSEYEKNLGTQNPALRDAAYFLRKIGSVKGSLDILGDKVLRSVVTYTLGLPDQIALQSIKKQQQLIEARLDIAKLQTAGGAGAIGSGQSIEEAKQDVTAIDKMLGVASAAATQVQAVIARLQALKDDYDRLVNIQDPAGPYATEIPVQEAAAPELTRQSGLLAAARDAAGVITTKLARMDELIDLSRDSANAASLADYKTEFADLRAAIQSAVSGATYSYDDADADSAGTAQNLLDGSLPSAIAVTVNAAGDQISIRSHDLTAMLAAVDAANTSFQAVADASDTANLDAAQSSRTTADTAANAAAVTLDADTAALDAGIAAITQWAATFDTAQLYPGYQSLRDAGSRVTQIQLYLGEIRGIAQESLTRAAGADRSDLATEYNDLVTKITDLVNTAGTGLNNLLVGGSQVHALINNVFLQARGRDLTTSVNATLAGNGVGTEAEAQALLDALDATVDPAVTTAGREIAIDTQPFAVAATRLDPRAAVDSKYRALYEEMGAYVKAAAVGNDNLLTATQSDLTLRVQTSGRTLTISALTTFDADVTQMLKAGADLLPSSTADISGALAKLNETMFNANRALSLINSDIRGLNAERGVAQAVVTAGASSDGSANPVPFAATEFAIKFIQKYLIKKDQEAVTGSFGLANLLDPISARNSTLTAIAGLAGRSRISFLA